jgi:nitroreductase
METWDAIRTRRNVRRFADRPIADEDLDRIVAAAALAPSSMNEQELSNAGPYAGHVAGAAAAIAFVTPRPSDVEERESIAFDLGQAVENAMVAAWDLGIGSCHASVYEQDRMRSLLGYPEDSACDLIVSFGYPADAAMAPPGSRGGRKPIASVRHDERFRG